jgi:hypothetical protein
MAVPSKRKSEVRRDTQGSDAVLSGRPIRRRGGGSASADMDISPNSQCSTWEWPVEMTDIDSLERR